VDGYQHHADQQGRHHDDVLAAEHHHPPPSLGGLLPGGFRRFLLTGLIVAGRDVVRSTRRTERGLPRGDERQPCPFDLLLLRKTPHANTLGGSGPDPPLVPEPVGNSDKITYGLTLG
jgi:hypothetical protein